MRYLIIMGMAFTVSCVVGPKYQKPVTTAITPQQYRDSQFSKVGDSISYLNWWDMFRDPALQGLIKIAVKDNRNIRATLARVEESRLNAGMVGSTAYPSFEYAAQTQRVDLSNNNANEIGGGAPRGNVGIGLRASWEPDFWGKYRAQRNAAEADVRVREEDYRWMYVSLIAEVATQYFLLRDLDERLEIAQRTLSSRESTFDIINKRFEKGEVAELDKLQAEGQVAIANATIYSLQRSIRQTENALSMITGQTPMEIRRGLKNHEQVFPELPVGLPSTLLSQRPDVRAAENALQAQAARIGVAEALRYPSFNIMAALGLYSQDFSSLFSTNALANMLGGAIAGPLFQFGRNKQRVAIEQKRSELLLLQYEQSVLTAMKDVQDGLAGIDSYRKERAALEKLVYTSRKTYELSLARYDAGYSSYLELLDAERMLFDSENRACVSRREQLISMVNLYRALGGGWDRNVNF
jgi:multidrug efflux system outer membrane protein